MMLTFGTLNAQETKGTHGINIEESGAMPEAIREAYDDFLNYRFGEAEQRLRKLLKSAAGKEESVRVMAEELLDKTARCRQALGHVQRIEVVDSLEVDRDGFFRQYRLPLSAGRILSRDEFPEEDWKEDAEMAYSNESGNL
ncbi:MAG: hypothetical protein K2F64_06020, partial [Muribaculaceae bacterium]|nr:hypothetical protein [Muribaculaceae bacterium]